MSRLIEYAKSIESNNKKREKAIEGLHKQIAKKKEQVKKFAGRAKEIRKMAEGGKPKPKPKAKAKAKPKPKPKMVIKVPAAIAS